MKRGTRMDPFPERRPQKWFDEVGRELLEDPREPKEDEDQPDEGEEDSQLDPVEIRDEDQTVDEILDS